MINIWFIDMFLPVGLVLCVLAIGVVWILARKAFKKIPWEHFSVLLQSFFSVIEKMWRILPRVWRKEFFRRKKTRTKMDE